MTSDPAESDKRLQGRLFAFRHRIDEERKYENIFLKKKPFLFLKRKKERSWLFGRFSL
jgi:hypothetical protein